MGSLTKIIHKNLRILIRARTSAAIIFIGPLILVTLLGLAFSQSSTFSLSAGVFTENYSDLTEGLVDKMAEQELNVIKFKTLNACVTGVKTGEVQVCVYFPDDLEIVEGKTNEVTFHVDYSQINLVWIILDAISSGVAAQSDEIAQGLTSDLLGTISKTQTKMGEAKNLVSTLKSGQKKLQADLVEITAGLEGIDLDVKFTKMDAQAAMAESSNVESRIEILRAEAKNKAENTQGDIADAKSKIDEAISLLNDSSVILRLNSAKNQLDAIYDEMEKLKNNVNADASTAGLSVDKIRNSLNAIMVTMDETTAQFVMASEKRAELTGSIAEIQKSLDVAVTNINSIDNLLSEITLDLQGLTITDVEQIVTPITTKIQPITREKSHFANMFPSLLVLIMMVTGVLLSSTIVTTEKKSRAFYRNHITPTSFVKFNTATYLTTLLITMMQLVMFVAISAIAFGADVFPALHLVFILLLLVSTMFIFIGMLVGFLFRTAATATLAAVTASTVMLLFSNIVIPLEGLPALARKIAQYNPFVVGEVALRKAVIFHFGFVDMINPLVVILAYGALFFVLLILLQVLFNKLALVHFEGANFGGKKGEVPLTSAQVGGEAEKSKLLSKQSLTKFVGRFKQMQKGREERKKREEEIKKRPSGEFKVDEKFDEFFEV